jgi:uncharacterized protein
MVEGTSDPAEELAEANRRHRRRILAVVGAAAAAVAVAGALLYWRTRPGPEIPPIAHPYLWEVTGGGAPAPSYLFGTLHIAYGVDALPAAVLAAQDRSAITVTESDLLREPAPDAPPPPPHRGRARLTDREWARMAKITGIAEEELVTRDSGQLVGTMLVSQTPRVEAMDRALQRRAAAAGKELVFLEARKVDEVTADVDDEYLIESLEQMIANPRRLRNELLGIVRSYASGRDGGCSGAQAEVKRFKDLLNAEWEAGVVAQVRRGGAFIAIGCAHLDGPASIVARLQGKGFQVRRVP